MKRHPIMAIQVWMTVMLSVLLSNCDKEKVTVTNIRYEPIYKTLTEVRADMKGGAARTLENPGKIYIFGKYIFLNELNEGIHIIDNSEPTSPRNIAFIPVPGSVDLAVTGNTLYADSYSDLVTFDISNPLAVVAKKFMNNVFPYRNRYYWYNSANRPPDPDSIKVVVGWNKIESTTPYDPTPGPITFDYAAVLNSAGGGAQKSAISVGAGGSMARFTLMNNYLYTVSTSELFAFDISTPQEPQFIKKTFIPNQVIETIYPFRDKLFIGSTSGMYIFDVSTPGNPVKQSQFTHVRSCDPVIADENTAWVTLRSGTACGGNVNELQVVNVTDVTKPSLITTYPMKNPFGLGKEGNVLFICDGKEGVKVYDAADAKNLKLLKHITGMESYDVIAWHSKALVVAKDGLYQFDYSNVNDIRLMSKIGL